MSEEKFKVSRRNFLKSAGIAGVTVGTIGTTSLVKAQPAIAGETGQPIVDITVKRVDQPKYKTFFEGSENLKRFDNMMSAFNHPEAVKMREEAGVSRAETQINQIKEGIDGSTHIDHALANACNVSRRQSHYYSWEPMDRVNSWENWKEAGIKKWEGTPEEANKILKKASSVLGDGPLGVTTVNEQWFYSKEGRNGRPVIFSDKHDKAVVEEEAKYIPKSWKTLIVMAHPQVEEVMGYTPSALGGVGAAMGYSRMAEKAAGIAEFIRGLGYNAAPMGNDTGLSVPMAIDAGLGELGRHGLLVTPKYGTWVRLTKVLTDMPVAPDKPIDFGVAEFCRTCMKCADYCPSESIPFERDPSYEIACDSNNPGMKRWHVNTWTCRAYWDEIGTGCSLCIANCPYNKPATWIHDAVKGVSAKTTLFNSTFAKLDDVFGYGGSIEDNPAKKWWDL